VALAAAKTGDDLDAMGEAIAMYRGEFLAGLVLRDAPVFDEWLLLQREYFRSTLVQALQATLDRQAPYGTAGAGLELARRLLAIEPWREEAHRALMVLLARSGQRSAALAQFAACRRILAQELGVEPSQPTLELFQRLKAGPAPIPTIPRCRCSRSSGARRSWATWSAGWQTPIAASSLLRGWVAVARHAWPWKRLTGSPPRARRCSTRHLPTVSSWRR
jgi:hypothetical protein